jgi:hypothetical protein
MLPPERDAAMLVALKHAVSNELNILLSVSGGKKHNGCNYGQIKNLECTE